MSSNSDTASALLAALRAVMPYALSRVEDIDSDDTAFSEELRRARGAYESAERAIALAEGAAPVDSASRILDGLASAVAHAEGNPLPGTVDNKPADYAAPVDRHTAGPWAIIHGTDKDGFPKSSIYQDVRTAGGYLCLFEPSGDAPQDEEKANLRLVKASPDLLAIVRTISAASHGQDGTRIPVTLDEELQDDIAAVLSYVEGLI